MAGLVWEWIQTQLLGMQWLSDLVGTGLERMGLDLTSRLGGSIQFFLYDVGKISLLLVTLIFAVSYVQSYFPPQRAAGSWGGSGDCRPMCLGHCWGR